MKTLVLLLVTAASALAGDLYQHFALPLIDCYIDSAVTRDPDIPGMTGTHHTVAISLNTQDSATSAYAVYLRVLMADGSQRVFRTILDRDGVNPSTARFQAGEVAPVKISAFYVTRLHAEPADQLIHP